MKEETKIILHDENSANNPECPHGPTLMFSRGVGARRFFACSAYRDRKDCEFYLGEDDKITAGKKLAWSIAKEKLLPKVDFENLKATRKKVFSETPKKRAYCHTCNCLFLTDEGKSEHKNHDLFTNLSDQMLHHPSKFIKMKESSKKESQFLFDNSTIECLLSGLGHLDVEKLMCIGTPSLKENSKIPSMLLDIDHRYATFYDDKEFQWFNMSNFHFFSQTGLENLKNFFYNSKSALVIDPPFGALIQPIATTVQKIVAECNLVDPPVLLILPYFMEKQVLNHFPDFTMLDYEVNYVNHDKFNTGGRKLGSPVRIFTNLKKFTLPESQGYRFCKICDKWVSVKNRHCKECNDCTSKNGSTYKHCLVCDKCVKPSWEHCDVCQRCTLANHDCSSDGNPLVGNPFKRKMKFDAETKSKKSKNSKKNKSSKYHNFILVISPLSIPPLTCAGPSR